MTNEQKLISILKDKKNTPTIIVRCNVCGEFMGKKDFNNDNVSVDFIPDSALTVEEVLYEHKKCPKPPKKVKT